jgi:hypothetical protein
LVDDFRLADSYGFRLKSGELGKNDEPMKTTLSGKD